MRESATINSSRVTPPGNDNFPRMSLTRLRVIGSGVVSCFTSTATGAPIKMTSIRAPRSSSDRHWACSLGGRRHITRDAWLLLLPREGAVFKSGFAFEHLAVVPNIYLVHSRRESGGPERDHARHLNALYRSVI